MKPCNETIDMLNSEGFEGVKSPLPYSTNKQENSVEWGDYVSLDNKLSKPPKLIKTMMPDILWQYISEIEDKTGLSSDYLFLSTLVSLSTLISRLYQVSPSIFDSSWVEHPNLYGLIIGEPSSCKTQCLQRGTRFLTDLNRHFMNLDNEKRRKLAHLESNNKNDSVNTHGHKINRYQLIVNDTTPEALIRILEETNNNVLFFRDELSGLFADFKKKTKEGLRELILLGWAGSSDYTKETIGGGTVYVPRVSLSVLGGIQPSILNPLLERMKKGVEHDGLMERFLFVNSKNVRLKVQTEPFRQDYSKPLEEIYKRLGILIEKRLNKKRLTFSKEAQEVFDNFRQDLYYKVSLKNQDKNSVSFLGKYTSHFCAFSVIYQVIISPQEPSEVTLDAAKMALNSCKYFEKNLQETLLGIHSDTKSPTYMLAKRIMENDIKSGEKIRSIRQRNLSSLNSKEKLDEATTELEKRNWLKVVQSSGTGRPSYKILINPQVPVSKKTSSEEKV